MCALEAFDRSDRLVPTHRVDPTGRLGSVRACTTRLFCREVVQEGFLDLLVGAGVTELAHEGLGAWLLPYQNPVTCQARSATCRRWTSEAASRLPVDSRNCTWTRR